MRPPVDRINWLLAHFDARLVRHSTFERLLRQQTATATEIRREFQPGSWVIAVLSDGLRIWVDLGDYGVSRGCLAGNYESDETSFLLNHLPPGGTFVDIGANIGWFTLQGACRVGHDGRVLAFEPRRSSFERLLMSVRENSLDDVVRGFNVALGARRGRKRIAWARNTDNPGGTWFMSHETLEQELVLQGHEFQETAVTTLDEVLAGQRVDLIKIDVEGAEHLVMSGASETLRASKPIILSEVNFALLPIVSQVTPAEYSQSLIGLGYRCYAIEGGQIGSEISIGEHGPGAPLINVVFAPR